MNTTIARRTAASVVLVLAVFAAGCTAPAVGDGPAATVGPSTRSDGPSASAEMICQPEVETEMLAALGVQPSRPPTSSWTDHLFSCQYTYPTGVMVLSVKELVDGADTTRYYTAMQNGAPQYADTKVLGLDGFVVPDGSTFVRKDFKVLHVDVSALPDSFGQPPRPRADDAFTIAAVIMGCWTGS